MSRRVLVLGLALGLLVLSVPACSGDKPATGSASTGSTVKGVENKPSERKMNPPQ